MNAKQKYILLAITGGIAAYKSCELVRLLTKAGYQVQVVMSHAATNFVHSNTFQALTGRPVYLDQDLFTSQSKMAHIELTRNALAYLIAPATANTIAKIANGIADGIVTSLAGARNCPLIIAPAMNQEMWHNPANLRNIERLKQDGVTILGPTSGVQACGEEGLGRMLEPVDIAELLADVWATKSLLGKNILITAGATFEAIDPVRGISNISSGKMAMALASACRRAGAKVSLVHGLLQSAVPAGLQLVIKATTTEQMYQAVHQNITNQDIFISVAAVADYKVKTKSSQKIKKNNADLILLELEKNPDILASVAALDKPPFCVGFACESEHLIEYARQKQAQKGVPLMVANLAANSMTKDSNQVTLIDQQETALPPMTKQATAQAIVARIAELID